jgi:hypothetical protein
MGINIDLPGMMTSEPETPVTDADTETTESAEQSAAEPPERPAPRWGKSAPDTAAPAPADQNTD